MKWLIKKIKMKAILPAAAFLAAAAIGTTFAWQTWDLSVTNELKSHTTEVEVEEPEFDPSTGTKQVQFTNTGNSSVFLRVSYTEYWEKEENNTSYLISNTAADGTEMATKHWTDDWASEWTNGNDGWYYYNKVLEPGTSTNLILEEVTFENVTTEEYLNAHYRLYFKAEVVQCSDGSNTLNSEEVNKDATNSLFGKIAQVVEISDGDKIVKTVVWDEK
ncbi:MAG: hypothetical protein HFG56_00740 [Lachnospiraceae bacterium]|nr:hypothetical protein [Lachnospiraceae bacterium]MCI9281794.1 hypothetical protein [Lachnospiraceae bacterium]